MVYWVTGITAAALIAACSGHADMKRLRRRKLMNEIVFQGASSNLAQNSFESSEERDDLRSSDVSWTRFLEQETASMPSYPPTLMTVQSARPSMVQSKAPSTFPSAPPTISIETQNQIVTCISVIDESGGQPNNFDVKWDDLRTVYPDRPFCLLQPQYPDGTPTNDTLDIPPQFYNESLSIYEPVSRNAQDASNRSDWYNICGLAEQRQKGINRVGKQRRASSAFVVSQRGV